MERVGSGVDGCVGEGGGEQEIIPKKEKRRIRFKRQNLHDRINKWE